jgi:hypothetical protein
MCEHDLIGIGNFGNFGFVQYVLDVVKLAALPAQKCKLHWGLGQYFLQFATVW